MKKYIVLLRGINVGGKNKVSMKELKELFEKNGFHDVITYSRTRWSNVVGSSVYDSITIRNSNTVKKLMELCHG